MQRRVENIQEYIGDKYQLKNSTFGTKLYNYII